MDAAILKLLTSLVCGIHFPLMKLLKCFAASWHFAEGHSLLVKVGWKDSISYLSPVGLHNIATLNKLPIGLSYFLLFFQCSLHRSLFFSAALPVCRSGMIFSVFRCSLTTLGSWGLNLDSYMFLFLLGIATKLPSWPHVPHWCPVITFCPSGASRCFGLSKLHRG